MYGKHGTELHVFSERCGKPVQQTSDQMILKLSLGLPPVDEYPGRQRCIVMCVADRANVRMAQILDNMRIL